MQNDDFSSLPQGEYDGIAFPVGSVTLTHGSAAAFHKAPHRPGQRVEYTGREPVSGEIMLPMFNTLVHEHGGANAYWPTGIILLRERSQTQKSKRLVIPPFGTIDRAFIRIVEHYDGSHRDGGFITLSFVEDNTDLISKGTAPTAASKVPRLSADLDTHLAALALSSQQKIDDIAGLNGQRYTDFVTACSALLASKDQLETSIANRITLAERIVRSIDSLFTTLGSTFSDPVAWEARSAALNLKDSVLELKTEGTAAAAAIKTYVTAARSSIVDVSTATRNSVEELLALNPMPNGFDIDEGEILYVYDR